MNTNKQAEIEDLFNKVNNKFRKNTQYKLTNDDLDKCRGFIVESKCY